MIISKYSKKSNSIYLFTFFIICLISYNNLNGQNINFDIRLEMLTTEGMPKYENYKKNSDKKLKKIIKKIENGYKTEYNFDQNGNELAEVNYTTKGTQDNKFIYFYDNQQRLMKSEKYDQDNKKFWYYVFEYDAQDFLVKKNTFDFRYTSLCREDSFENDFNGNQIKGISKMPNGSIVNGWTISYDFNSRINEYSNLNDLGEIQYKYRFIYDESGFMTEEQFILKGNDDINSRTTFINNNLGERIEKHQNDHSGKNYCSTFYIYDNNNFLTNEQVEVYDMNSKEITSYSYEFYK